MEHDMVVYESEEAKRRNPADTGRFGDSVRRLSAIGITVDRVVCTSPSDVSDPEAAELVSGGMDKLPIAVYQGVPVSVGKYPSDQDLANYLDVPDGVLSADKEKAPAMPNDMVRCCCSFVNTPGGR